LCYSIAETCDKRRLNLWGRPAAQWIFAADVAHRHDQAHLLTHHAHMPLSALANLISQADVGSSSKDSCYRELLKILDDSAGRQISAALADLAVLTEPHVAHALSKHLPKGVCPSHTHSSCSQALVFEFLHISLHHLFLFYAPDVGYWRSNDPTWTHSLNQGITFE